MTTIRPSTTRRGFRSFVPAIRRGVQLASLLFFLWLAVLAVFPFRTALPVDLYLRLDPLVALTASFGGRGLAPNALWALPVLLLTLAFGRVFCGWLCPLGTILDAFRFDNRARRLDYTRLRGLRYFLLLLVVVGAVLGSLTLLVLDPITLLLRALATALLPAFDHAATALLLGMYQGGILPDLASAVDAALRPAILPIEQHEYRGGLLMFAILAGVVSLNLLAPRFWCRYLCPLGALLALVGRITPLRRFVGSECDRCAKCVAQCKMAAIHGKSLASDSAECVQCLDCVEACPKRAISVGLGVPEVRYSPSRRRFLAGVGLGVAGVAITRIDASAFGHDQYAVRPPGSVDDFASRCVRCGECVKVCPTAALHPAGLETGVEGLWTPVLVARLGNCDWGCNACGQVCPTGAIRPLALPVKQQTVVGSAYIDQSRCLPWADNRDCIVCQEMCPVPEKAIVLDDVEAKDSAGVLRTLRRPRVERERCIGCGICENRCPLPKEAAIRVRATNAAVTGARG